MSGAGVFPLGEVVPCFASVQAMYLAPSSLPRTTNSYSSAVEMCSFENKIRTM
jgi:hypothetical protein